MFYAYKLALLEIRSDGQIFQTKTGTNEAIIKGYQILQALFNNPSSNVAYSLYYHKSSFDFLILNKM